MVKRAVQVLPYMRFAKDDPDLSRLLCGVVRRQAYSVTLNPYANAFNYNNSKHTISLPLQATSSLKVDLHPCPTILGHGCTMTYPVKIIYLCYYLQAVPGIRMIKRCPT
jgi:meiotically up-regulated gene 157 (Mug157) protein